MNTILFRRIFPFLTLFLGLFQATLAQIAVTTDEVPMSRANIRQIPPIQYRVKKIAVTANVRNQVTETQVSQTIHNPTRSEMQVEMLFPLPAGGAVSGLTLMVNGQEMPGRLLPQDEARRIYEEIVRRKQDPALMEYAGLGLFRTRVFPVPAGEDRTIVIKYTQLLDKIGSQIHFTYPFGTQKFSFGSIDELSLRVRLEDNGGIGTIFSPSDNISIQRENDRTATISFQQENVRRETDFRLNYAQSRNLGASLLSYKPVANEEGYFMMLLSPEVQRSRRVLPKRVVFVLDKSGSMAGQKIRQAKDALKYVLNHLNREDQFNIVCYDDSIQPYKNEMLTATSDNVQAALRFVEGIEDGGGTNIHDALQRGLTFVRNSDRPAYLLFMTDGLPTAGNTDELEIAKTAKSTNAHQTRIFTFGVGEDVNARLLDRLVSENGGISTYVRTGENLESKVSDFYGKIQSPVLTNVRITLEGSEISRSYPQQLPDVFEGGQLVWVGRYREGGNVKIRISGTTENGERTWNVEERLKTVEDGGTEAFVEKIWASRRIGYIIDQMDLNGRNEELVAELVALSKKHGILTPYTAFFADENTNLNDVRANAMRAMEGARDLEETSGDYANAQRAYKQEMMNAEVASAPAMEVLAAPSPRSRGRNQVSSQVSSAAPAAQPVQTIQRVGNKTFFLRSNIWIDAEIEAEDEQKAQNIRQLSSEYFALMQQNNAEVNQYFSFSPNILVKVNGQVYRIMDK